MVFFNDPVIQEKLKDATLLLLEMDKTGIVMIPGCYNNIVNPVKCCGCSHENQDISISNHLDVPISSYSSDREVSNSCD